MRIEVKRLLVRGLAAAVRAVILLSALLVPLRANALEVVVHAELGITEIKLITLRAIFGMRLLEWPDGTPVKVFVLDVDSDLHSRFAKNMLQVFPYQLQQAWDRLVFSGTGQAPLHVESIEEMQRRLVETPGAIGYLPTGFINERISKVEIVEQ